MDRPQRVPAALPSGPMVQGWRRCTGLAAVAALSACASQGGGALPASPAVAVRPVFATQLAGPSTFLAPMPTAVVVLKPGDLNRNRAFCSAITGRLPTAQQALAGSVVAPNLVLTRWLVQLPDFPAERAADCDFLVGTYDYARAGRLIGASRLTEGRLSGPGPFLIMVIPDSAGLHVVGLDGSSYSEAEFGRFVDSWGSALRATEQEVSREPDRPGLVRSVFNLVSAIVRTAAGAAGGLIRGVIEGV